VSPTLLARADEVIEKRPALPILGPEADMGLTLAEVCF
jgi:hypothetical protein